jgi:ATP-dependent DNA helicase DinG
LVAAFASTSRASSIAPSLSPQSFNLPARFKDYRVGQAEAAIALWESDKRFSGLSAPPGSGKTAIAFTAINLLDARTLYLTATRNLQRQVAAEFEAIGLTNVLGASNYRCVALDENGLLAGYGKPGSSCADGPCRVGVRCRLRDGGCLHYDAEARARNSKLVLTNYAKWISLGRYSDPESLGKFDLIIADEAHLAADILTEFCAVELSREEIKRLLGLDLPALDEGVEVWATWAKGAALKASMKQKQLRDELQGCSRAYRQQFTKQLLRLSSLERDLIEMSRAGGWLRTDDASKQVDAPGTVSDWIAYATDKGARFTPVWAHQYAEKYLFRGVKRAVLSSGTLMPSTMKRLGIDERQYDWHEVKSSFDPKRRPIIYIPTTRLDQRSTEGQKRMWMNRIDQIVRARLDKKILIHSVSYKRAEEIRDRAVKAGYAWARYVMIHTSRETQATVEKFKKAKAPCVLISPALTEGVDFPDDEVRVQILCKVPFASATDPLFKARCKADNNYRFECAALLMVQMSGRGMRSAQDAVESWVIDDHYDYLRGKVAFPSWYKAAWRQLDNVPAKWTAAA